MKVDTDAAMTGNIKFYKGKRVEFQLDVLQLLEDERTKVSIIESSKLRTLRMYLLFLPNQINCYKIHFGMFAALNSVTIESSELQTF